MLRPDDPYNQGIGTLDLGDMNLGNMNVGNVGQVPVNNMQQANWLNTISGGMMGTTSEQDAQNAALEEIQGLRNQEQQINALGEGAQYLKQDELKSIQKQIQEIKNQFKDVKSIQSASLKDEYDFSDIEGQTAMINPLSIIGLVKAGLSKKEIAKVLMKNELQKEIGKKVKPIITGAITGGGAQAAPGGGQWVGGSPAYTHQGQGGGEFIDTQGNVDYHDPYDPGGGEARGGFIDGTNRRRSYFNGGLASLWLR